MAYRKMVVTKQIQKLIARKEGSKAIGAVLDLGNEVTLEGYEEVVQNHLDAIEKRNQIGSQLDKDSNAVIATAKEVKDYGDRWLKAVGLKYGFDSDEYEMAGGTRKSERKKPGKKGDGNIPTP